MTESEFRVVDVNSGNIDKVGAFCLQSKKHTEGYKAKVEWMKRCFGDGLRYKLLLVNEGAKRGFRGRGFIEYIPGEFAWRGVSAEDYMVIHCIWVVGKNKGKGYGTKLLQECLEDAEIAGLSGACVVTSDKTWLPKRRLFLKNGFELADALPGFELYAKRFKPDVPFPRFSRISKSKLEKYGEGFVVFRSCQCPYSAASIQSIEELAKELEVPFHVEYVENCKQAQNMVNPYGTFSVVYNRNVVTHRPIGKKDLKEYIRTQKL